MCSKYDHHMSKLLQIRNVPEAVHRTLKARAANAGMSLSNYLLAEVERLAARPTLEEMRVRLQRRRSVKLSTSVAHLIRAERSAR
jgi:plasmid stability protein